jgi:hypothetical protein
MMYNNPRHHNEELAPPIGMSLRQQAHYNQHGRKIPNFFGRCIGFYGFDAKNLKYVNKNMGLF